MKKLIAALGFSAAVLGWAGAANAFTIEDHLRVKVGVSGVLPDEDADVEVLGGSVDVSDEYVPSLQLEWMFTDNISAELLCCVATHDVEHSAGIDLGEVSHFPPTVTVKYRFNTDGMMQPYVGAGVNWTKFYDTEPPSSGPVTSISYDDSFGPALQLGLDIMTDEHWFVNLDVRKIWINTDVTLEATGVGTLHADVDIDPIVASASVGYRF